MSLDSDIAAYLYDAFFATHRPFCFCITADYALTEWSGDAAGYGFENLDKGMDMLERAPFLLNMPAEEPVELPMVVLPGIGPVEIHIFPRDREYAVVLLKKDTEHVEIRTRQQSVNEFRLLQLQQRRLIGRQRALIAELVEARGQLERQRQKAEDANLAKGRFIAMMSHEFRTPLASIISYAGRLNEERQNADSVEQCGKAIARAANHLNDLVNSVLDEARLDAGRLKLQKKPVSMRDLVDDLAAMVAPLAAEKALSFAAQVTENVPDWLELDDGCLRQIMLNVVGNSVKYTDEGQVRILVDWSDDTLSVDISDDGPGIAPADQQRMFEAFERGAASSSGVKGTGLGLSISLRLTELMRGELRMISDIGEGCQVILTVPAVRAAPATSTHPLDPPAARLQTGQPAVILICDDDEDMRAIQEYYLARAGYELLIAGDGETALQLAHEKRPDLAMLDINTPGLSGIDVARRLRATGYAAPIVALTASDASRLDPGLFDERLRKPLHMEVLLKTLKSLLDRSQVDGRRPHK